MDLKKYNRIVIKIGSSTIMDEKGVLRAKWLKSFASDIKKLNKEVIIVTSGAVALGRKHVNDKPKAKLKLEEKQAASAIGQIELMKNYKAAFGKTPVAQVLLTLRDTETRISYLNAKNAIEMLLKSKAVPVINENDAVATAELRYGDNDRLSARVAQMLGADLLILLSDIDGLYTANPANDKNAKHIQEVKEITKSIEAMAGGSSSDVGTGGMKTKIDAAKIAVAAGCDCIIMNGNAQNSLKNLEKSTQKYTIFTSKLSPLNARKQWILAGVNPVGKIHIDQGAVGALLKGSSLLPAGATKIEGEFERGDLVIITSANGEIARGLSAYSSEDAIRIIGKKSAEIEKILGFAGRSELVHRDDLVLMK